jgi:hypothetical protein
MFRFTRSHDVLMSICMAALLIGGCDRQRPQAANQQPDQSSAPATQASATLANRPTTGQLLNGEQVRIPLRAIPFTVSVPKGWQLKANAGIITLEGPTPSGTVQIQVSRHVAPIAQHAERLIEGAKKEVQNNSSKYGLAEVRNMTPEIRCLEYRTVARDPIGGPTIDSTGRQIAPTATPMQWKLTAFVPHGRDTDLCELAFIDLTLEQFEIDRPVLEKVFASFQYDPQAASG